MSEYIPEDLVAGEPVISVRWRLHKCALPLKNRHLRAFESRGISAGLRSWARQHIEWTLAEGALKHPDGVMTLIVDEQGRAAMNVEPYVALTSPSVSELSARAALAEADEVPSEVLWIARDGSLFARVADDKALSGANSLVVDLAKTLKMPVVFDMQVCPAEGDEVMLVSDEHGVVAAGDAGGTTTERFGAYYGRLLGTTKPDTYDCGNLGIF